MFSEVSCVTPYRLCVLPVVLLISGVWLNVIQYLRELRLSSYLDYWMLSSTMLGLVYNDLYNNQLYRDSNEVKWPWPLWWKFVQSTPRLYASMLAAMTWKDLEEPTVDEWAGQLWQYEKILSSSLQACILAVGKLSQENNLKRIYFPPHLYKPVSQLSEVM